MLFKRVIALPGETIAIREGQVIINNSALDEPYLRFKARWNTEPVTLSTNEYFLIGDNRGMGQTEHEFGRGPRSNIIGRALW